MTADRAHERESARADLARLAIEMEPRDRALGALLHALREAVGRGRPDEIRGLVAAIDPRTAAELLSREQYALWSLLEVARNVVVFAPIAVTWFGLSTASTAYASLLASRPDLSTRPFLLLWQQGFEGAAGVINFSALALVDASLIGILIAISLALHVRSELYDVKARTRALLTESRIRALLARVAALAEHIELDDEGGERVLDEMVAEERRIYERAMEREQQLLEIEGAVRELRDAVAELAAATGRPARAHAKRAGEPGRAPVV